MSGELGAYLHDRVYPNLDAVERGLLDSLAPVRQGKAYKLNCPACGQRHRAFYYPGSGVLHCNRKNECGKTVTVWTVLQELSNLSNREILAKLCDAAGVPLPDDKRPRAAGNVALIPRRFFDVVRRALEESDEAMAYLRDERGMTADEIRQARIGYYPRPDYVEEKLRTAGLDLVTAKDWGLIGPAAVRFSKRIVGYWEQPDGSIRLWGRGFGASLLPVPDGKGGVTEPKKYEFAFGLVKTIPYRFRQASRKGVLAGVEGPLDVERMVVNGIPTVGLGGACLIEAQAAFLSTQGITSFVHVTDGDRAGYDGALQSIAHAEPLGISVLVVQIPPELDDPDKLISKKGTEPLQKLLDDAVPAGAFLARDIAFAPDVYGNHHAQVIKARLKLAEQLTAASKVSFQTAMQRYGLGSVSLRSQALRHAAALLESGLPEDEMRSVIRRQYSFDLAINLEEKTT